MIGRLRQIHRKPLTNPYGLRASEVLDLHAAPLFDPFNMVFDGTTLTVYGAHLPPEGDPSKLSVRCNPGVRYTFESGMYSPDFGDHYWYWPNAHLSAFRLRLDLSGSEGGADPFSFTFVHGRDDAPPRDGKTIYIPHRLSSFVHYPRLDQMTRVQTYDNIHSANFSGYHAYRSLEKVLMDHDFSFASSLLDFGCGYGRIARHFSRERIHTQICGLDVDAQNVKWCQDHLSNGDFRVGPLWPETGFETGRFEAIFSVSVMTHFTAAAQDAWLKEFRRLLQPGGLALLTFSGAGAAAYTSGERTPSWWRQWAETGFDDAERDLTLANQLGDPTYYRNTLQTEADVRRRWGVDFTVEDIVSDFLGYQSLAVLRSKT